MKRSLLTVVICLTTTFLSTIRAQELEQHFDSLRRVASEMPHNHNRLELLQQITQSTQSGPEGVKDSRALLQEALIQKNDSLTALAATFICNHFYNFDEQAVDSIRYWKEYTLPIAKRCKFWKPYFQVQWIMTSCYIFNDRFEYALDEAQHMAREAEEIGDVQGLSMAYLNMGMAYQGSKRWKEALAMYRKNYELFDQGIPFGIQLNTILQMLDYYMVNKHYAKMRPYVDDLFCFYQETIAQQGPSIEAALYDYYTLGKCFYIFYYSAIGDFAEAGKCVSEILKRVGLMQIPNYRKIFEDAYSYYFLQQNRLPEALAQNDTILQLIERHHLQEDDLILALERRGDIFYAMGDYDQALQLYTTADAKRDSLNLVISENQMKEIREMYELDKLQYEKNRLYNRNQLIINIFITLLMIGLLYLFLRLRHIYRALRHSAKETRAAVEITEEANEAKRRFLATMSHAIRVPLNSVVGFSQILALKEDLTDEERREFGEIIHSNTDKLMFLVNSVLDLSRLEAGMTKWQMSDYDLIQLCHDAIGSAQIQNPQLHITFDCATEQCPIHTDTNRMMQLFVSLLAGTVTLPKEEREIDFTLRLQDAMAEGTVKGSPLADVRNCNQETDLRHSINRLTLEYFGGSYRVEEETQAIRFEFKI
ncbi:MAG: histidine kinase dimerization/phospho-acceptor domain-containing protein [Bacteroides sp.]